MARPTKSDQEKRTKSINIALNEGEYNRLREMAGHQEAVVREGSLRPMPTRRRSIAGIVRQFLNGQNQQAKVVSDEERQALFQVAGMARNLNQLATQANAQGFASVASRTDELAEMLRKIISRYDRKS